MNILQKIVAYKKQEVEAAKKLVPEQVLRSFPAFQRSVHSMSKALRNSETGIIAEHKRRSPSRSVINQSHGVDQIVQAYQSGGASAISVLTDSRFFGGSLQDLALARDLTDLPLLRKEFVIDPYQLIEAKAYGADAILLIAAILSTKELSELSATARDLGLEILVEVHNSEELERSRAQDIHMLGVNNRNLKTFEVSISTSVELIDQIPQQVVPISESGISDPQSVKELKQAGYQGFLIGENFMKAEEPGRALTEFLNATQ